jgi:hypothetical protein
MNANAFLQKDYENEPTSGPKKQTQTNPIAERVKLMQSCYNYGRKTYQRNTLSLFEREGQTLCTYERALL